eukprot:1153525-Pelagomonas_calceolata.AAC.3
MGRVMSAQAGRGRRGKRIKTCRSFTARSGSITRLIKELLTAIMKNSKRSRAAPFSVLLWVRTGDTTDVPHPTCVSRKIKQPCVPFKHCKHIERMCASKFVCCKSEIRSSGKKGLSNNAKLQNQDCSSGAKTALPAHLCLTSDGHCKARHELRVTCVRVV